MPINAKFGFPERELNSFIFGEQEGVPTIVTILSDMQPELVKFPTKTYVGSCINVERDKDADLVKPGRLRDLLDAYAVRNPLPLPLEVNKKNC